MVSLLDSIRKFNLYASPRITNVIELADGLEMRQPISLADLMARLNALPNELRLTKTITTDAALGGRAEIIIRSDGSYTSSGHMRATGLPSFAFQVTAIVSNPGGRFQTAVMHQGRVFGTDTPGDRVKSWLEDGRNENIRQNWLNIAGNAELSVRKEYNLAGTLGTLEDIAIAFAEFVGVAAIANPGLATFFVLGSKLGDGAKEPWPFPKLPLGMTVAAGVLLVFGPGAFVPAIVAGGAVELAVEHRPLSEEEAAFAAKVFGNTLPPPERIILTNALGKDNRPFVMPGAGGSYLVNLGNAPFDHPMAYRKLPTKKNPDPQPGQLLLHELTHIWQAERWPAMTYFCRGVSESTYEPGSDASRPWSDFGIEQQATIVEQWYGADPAFLATEFKKPNPDFSKKQPHMFDRYIYGNIRAGLL